MTDRHAGYIVTLESNVREDDDRIIEALRMVKGVLDVQPVIADPGVMIAEARARREFTARIMAALEKEAPDRT